MENFVVEMVPVMELIVSAMETLLVLIAVTNLQKHVVMLEFMPTQQ
jgi:hypothetical protein